MSNRADQSREPFTHHNDTAADDVPDKSHRCAPVYCGMNRIDPGWLPETRDLYRQLGITIMAWGPDMLTVEAKSAARAKDIAAQLGHLGFKTIENKDDALCRHAELVKKSRGGSSAGGGFQDISRRRWDEQMEPVIWAACGIGFLISGLT